VSVRTPGLSSVPRHVTGGSESGWTKIESSCGNKQARSTQGGSKYKYVPREGEADMMVPAASRHGLIRGPDGTHSASAQCMPVIAQYVVPVMESGWILRLCL
jgi:hypothetical protein